MPDLHIIPLRFFMTSIANRRGDPRDLLRLDPVSRMACTDFRAYDDLVRELWKRPEWLEEGSFSVFELGPVQLVAGGAPGMGCIWRLPTLPPGTILHHHPDLIAWSVVPWDGDSVEGLASDALSGAVMADVIYREQFDPALGGDEARMRTHSGLMSVGWLSSFLGFAANPDGGSRGLIVASGVVPALWGPCKPEVVPLIEQCRRAYEEGRR